MNTRKPQTDLFGHGTCQLRSRVWIEGPDGTFPGYGRALLLERIRDYGSISAAARSGADLQSVNCAELDGDQFLMRSHIRLPVG